MDETSQLMLPLVQAAQAQKHVTVNEAFTRLDGLVHLRLQGLSTSLPPASATDGQVWAVPSGGVNAWAGHDGELAIAANGGWVFVAPQAGWRGWDVSGHRTVQFDGSVWVGDVLASAPSGAASLLRVLEFDHTLSAGATNVTTQLVPSHAMVLAATARVTVAITGSLTGWRLGMNGSDDRFGSGLGLGLGSFARGVLGSPLTSYSDLPLDLTAEGGNFAGGTVRVAVHYLEFTLPSL